MNGVTLLIKGLISEQPEEVQTVIKATYELLKSAVETAEATHAGAGLIALSLLGAEKQE